MKKIIGVWTVIFLSQFVNANSITGKVGTEGDEPVIFANVILFSTIDSTMAKLEYTQDDGSFSFTDVEDGNYWITIKYVGFSDHNTDVISLKNDSEFSIETITLKKFNTELEEVVITAQRPLLELKADRMVFHVEGSINAAGSDALELLQKSPGVIVDNSNNIMMMGKSGVQIYIDGKPSKLSGDDLANFLKALPASEIDNIELITNPSAKWDAEGNAGIINIKLKKNASLGANGTLNLSASQGHKTRYNGSLTGNYRNKKFNAYGTIGYNQGEGWNPVSIRSQFEDKIYDQNSLGLGGWETTNLRLGLDYNLSDKSTVGVLFNGYSNNGTWGTSSTTDIYSLDFETTDSYLQASSEDKYEGTDWNVNMNYQYEHKGRSLNLDVDYGLYENESFNFQPNNYFSTIDNSLLLSRTIKTEAPTTIEIKTARLDFVQPIGKGNLETGVKVSEVISDNLFNVYNEEDVLDVTRSNDFEYKEMVSAGYINYATKIDKYSIQLGLRGEHTLSDGNLVAMVSDNDQRVERDYFNLFPSGGITYQANEKNSIQLRYSRRLDRPNYQDLNPFRSQLDELTFEQGNPFLNPQYAHNISLTHSWNYSLNTSLNYTKTTDLIGRLTDALGENTTVIKRENIANQNTLSLSLSSPIPVNDWWSTFTSITLTHQQNMGSLGDNKTIDLTQNTVQFYGQHTIKLPNDIGMEVSGWALSPMIWEGNFRMESMYSIDVGFQKSFLDNKLNVKIGVSDIFRSQNWEGESILGDLKVNAHGGSDTRRARINISYRFGNDQIKSRERSTGIEDEKSRIKSDN